MNRPKSIAIIFKSGVICLGLFLLMIACQSSALSAPEIPAEPTIKLRVGLDKNEVTPGTVVRLMETIPANVNAEVSGFKHVVVHAGYFDKKSGGIVNLPPAKFVETTSAMDDGLPLLSGFSKPRTLNEIEPGKRGKVFEFKPKQIGVFLIRAEWSVKDARHAWHSPPIILIVVPPVDKQGNPVLKAEWLGEEERRR